MNPRNKYLKDDVIVFTLVSGHTIPRLHRDSLLRLIPRHLLRLVQQALVGPDEYFERCIQSRMAIVDQLLGPLPIQANRFFFRKMDSHLLKVTKGNQADALLYMNGFVVLLGTVRFSPRVPIDMQLDVYISGIERDPTGTTDDKMANGITLLALFQSTDHGLRFNSMETFEECAMTLLNPQYSVDWLRSRAFEVN